MTRYDEEEECRRFRVTGRVQGVFFRDSTRQVAESLKLTGYARNVPDGSVEILACGSRESLSKLESWLQSGPPRAEVENVEAIAVDVAKPPSFTIA
jgi:acylphosphatase